MIEIENKTPKEIVSELDKYIIGQDEAKRSMAIAFRNRYRRQQLTGEMQEEVTPKNILMIGPTGVGKTEIARRLAKITNAPFVKVEATKFTEVGYVGRDVEAMVRDLVENSLTLVRKDAYDKVRSEATRKANHRLLRLLVPAIKKEQKQQNQASGNPFAEMMNAFQSQMGNLNQNEDSEGEITAEIRDKRSVVKEQLEKGLLDNREIEVELEEKPMSMGNSNNQLEQMGIDLNNMMSQMQPKKRIKRTLTVAEARDIFIDEESAKLVNEADLAAEACRLAENAGIIFIDEFDKISSREQNGSNGQVSREGVQRDILPIVEGSQVYTKYGTVSTDHILFIASGAFHFSKPSDLIPELQGRFPIRVELNSLTKDDFVRILTEPHNSLIKQYIALIGTENVNVIFTQEAINRIAEIAFDVNAETDNIGARRLHTILEKLLEDLLFESAEMGTGEITITEHYVDEKLADIARDRDLSQYIL